MPISPTIHRTAKPTQAITGPIGHDTEFARFLRSRGRVLSRDEWIARNHNRPSLFKRLLGRG